MHQMKRSILKDVLSVILVLYLLSVFSTVIQQAHEPSNPAIASLKRFNEGMKRQLCKEDPARDGCEDYRDDAFCKDHPKMKGCRRFLWWRY